MNTIIVPRERVFTLQSLRNGKLYRLTAKEVQSFYDNHILGGTKRVLDRAVQAGTSFKDCLAITGTVLAQLWNQYGELTEVRAGENIITTVGKEAAIDRLQGNTPAVHDFMAIGTGSTAEVVGNTTLETEVGTRVQGTLSQPASTTDRLVSTFAAGNPGSNAAVTETGRFNASSAGNLFARKTFSVINKTTADSLQMTYDITIS